MSKMKFNDAMDGQEPSRHGDKFTRPEDNVNPPPKKKGRPQKVSHSDLPELSLDSHLDSPLSPIPATHNLSHEPSPIFEKMRTARQAKKTESQESYYNEDEDDFLKANLGTLKAIFTDEEIHKFKAQYSRMLRQFKEDVLFSEELQVFHAIKYEILMDRCLIEIKKMRDEVETFEEIRNELINISEDEDPQKEDKLMYWTKQIESHRSSTKIKSDEHSKSFERYTSIMTGLKATREQRIKNLEGANRSFIDVIRDMQKKDALMVEGVELEVYKYAVVKELMKLATPYEFMDGSVTEPVLTSETLKLQDYMAELKDQANKGKENV